MNSSDIDILSFKGCEFYDEENEIENIMEKARHKLGFTPEDYEIKKIPGYLATFNKELQSITVNPFISISPS